MNATGLKYEETLLPAAQLHIAAENTTVSTAIETRANRSTGMNLREVRHYVSPDVKQQYALYRHKWLIKPATSNDKRYETFSVWNLRLRIIFEFSPKPAAQLKLDTIVQKH